MTMTHYTSSMSDMDWDEWTDDIENTLRETLIEIADYDLAISLACSRLTKHQAFFNHHNPKLTPEQQQEQWMVVINSTAAGLVED